MRRCVVALAWLLVAACSGGDDDGGTEDLCVSGCQATLAAGCSNGPASQAVCEADCRMLQRSGPCTAAFATLQACANGKSVTCGPTGLPTVAGCESQQAAFNGCVNAPQ